MLKIEQLEYIIYPVNVIATPVLFRVGGEFVEADTVSGRTDLTLQQSLVARGIRLQRAFFRFGQAIAINLSPLFEGLTRLFERYGVER